MRATSCMALGEISGIIRRLDGDDFVGAIEGRGAAAVIPPQKNRIFKRESMISTFIKSGTWRSDASIGSRNSGVWPSGMRRQSATSWGSFIWLQSWCYCSNPDLVSYLDFVHTPEHHED